MDDAGRSTVAYGRPHLCCAHTARCSTVVEKDRAHREAMPTRSGREGHGPSRSDANSAQDIKRDSSPKKLKLFRGEMALLLGKSGQNSVSLGTGMYRERRRSPLDPTISD